MMPAGWREDTKNERYDHDNRATGFGGIGGVIGGELQFAKSLGCQVFGCGIPVIAADRVGLGFVQGVD